MTRTQDDYANSVEEPDFLLRQLRCFDDVSGFGKCSAAGAVLISMFQEHQMQFHSPGSAPFVFVFQQCLQSEYARCIMRNSSRRIESWLRQEHVVDFSPTLHAHKRRWRLDLLRCYNSLFKLSYLLRVENTTRGGSSHRFRCRYSKPFVYVKQVHRYVHLTES